MANIRNKALLVKLRLTKVEGGLLSSQQKKTERLKLNHNWDYQIAEHTNNSLVINANCQVEFSPEALFNIHTHYSIIYRLKDSMSQEEVRESIEELLKPAAEQNSLIVSQLTDKMRGNPMVIPPKVNLTKSEGNNLN